MVGDAPGRPPTLFLSPGRMSGAKGALALRDSLPPTTVLSAEQGYDADRFREALEDKEIAACIPARRGHKPPPVMAQKLHKQHHRIEKLLARLRGWRRIATRYDRCREPFLSAICIAAMVMFWLRDPTLAYHGIPLTGLMMGQSEAQQFFRLNFRNLWGMSGSP